MKKRTIIIFLYVLVGLFIALGPSVLFPVCHGEMKMSCFYTKQAEIGVGILVAVLGSISLLLKNEQARLGISIAQVLNGILALAFPLKLTGLCEMKNMDCHVQAFPAIVVGSVVLIFLGIVNILYIRKEKV